MRKAVLVAWVSAWVLLASTSLAGAEVSLDKIRGLESGGNTLAVSSAGCRGLYQIADVTRRDYNACKGKRVTSEDLHLPAVNLAVAEWYAFTRIPQLLRAYGVNVTDTRVLVAYNWGARKCAKWVRAGERVDSLPTETKEYVRRYYA